MNVHPTLEAVAWAICSSAWDGNSSHWRDWLPEARAALNALADAREGMLLDADRLREIAAEPVTVEDVLAAHQIGWVAGLRQCSCGSDLAMNGNRVAHVADMLRAAGLVSE